MNGKEIWKSLKASHFSIAENKLAKFLEDQRKVRSLDPERTSAKMTFAQAEAVHQRKLAAKVDLKPRTRAYWNEVRAALHRSWPALATSEIRKITPRNFEEWAAKHSKTVSSTRYNNTVAVLKHVFDAGMKAGAIYVNPAAVLTRVRVRPKMLNLPDRAQFQKMIGIMRKGGSRDSKNCADLAEGVGVHRMPHQRGWFLGMA